MSRQRSRNFSSSIAFNGTSTVITPAVSSAYTSTTPITIALWVKNAIDPADSAVSQALVVTKYIRTYIRTTDNLFKIRFDESTAHEATAPLGKGKREWRHVVGVYEPTGGNNSIMRVYIDGTLRSTTTSTALPTSVYTEQIGKQSTTFFSGKMDEVVLYNKALTAVQIYNLFRNSDVPTGAVYYYKLDEGSGTTAIDSSGNGNNAPIANGTYSTDIPTTSRSTTTSRTTTTSRLLNRSGGKCLNFNGTSNYVTTAHSTSLNLGGTTSNYTIACWVRLVRRKATDNVIVEKWTSASGAYPFTLKQNTVGKIRFAIFDGTNNPSADSTKSYDDGWHFLVGVRDVAADRVLLYVDGVLQGTGVVDSTTATCANSQALMFGNRNSGATSAYLKGSLDDVRIWNVALTASEISSLYTRNTVPQLANLVGEWTFDELSGTALDTSGNSNTATITGAIRSGDTRFGLRRALGKIVDVRGDLTVASVPGLVFELNNGYLLRGANQVVSRSLNGGAGWSTVYTWGNAAEYTRLCYQAANGNIFLGGNNASIVNSKLIRSTNNGATWTEVATSEASGWWHMTEDSSGNLYAQEYSVGNYDANELYAYNIWKSTDNGATWAKWYTNTPQSSPGAKDSIRHLHYVFCDSGDNFYTGFGDTALGFTGNTNKTFRINSDGSLGAQIVPTGSNGGTGMFEVPDGSIFMIGDATPNSIFKIQKNQDSMVQQVNVNAFFGSTYDTPFYDCVKGKDDVLYAITFGDQVTKLSYIFASGDYGQTWRVLKYTDSFGIYGNGLTVCRGRVGSRVYIWVGGDNYYSIPDYTRDQLLSLGGVDIE